MQIGKGGGQNIIRNYPEPQTGLKTGRDMQDYIEVRKYLHGDEICK
jgi:hypothetical protein